jgi:Tol biopolymer transport system component
MRKFKGYPLIIINLLLLISGCNSAVFITPQIPVGGINSNGSDESPAYSSDGRYLAFSSNRNGHRDIYLYDFQQRSLVSLPNLNRRDSSQDEPSLSSDGNYIAYVSNERGKRDILVYSRQTQRSTLLTGNIKGSVRQPTITGNASQVAFQTSETGQWKIAIVEYSP